MTIRRLIVRGRRFGRSMSEFINDAYCWIVPGVNRAAMEEGRRDRVAASMLFAANLTVLLLVPCCGLWWIDPAFRWDSIWPGSHLPRVLSRAYPGSGEEYTLWFVAAALLSTIGGIFWLLVEFPELISHSRADTRVTVRRACLVTIVVVLTMAFLIVSTLNTVSADEHLLDDLRKSSLIVFGGLVMLFWSRRAKKDPTAIITFLVLLNVPTFVVMLVGFAFMKATVTNPAQSVWILPWLAGFIPPLAVMSSVTHLVLYPWARYRKRLNTSDKRVSAQQERVRDANGQPS